MKNRIYKYFFHEFIGYFLIILFALTAVIWTIQAVNFLDLVTDDGHAFKIYFFYSFLTISKVVTKLFPFCFLIAAMLTILKLEKDNELIILWTSGLNKIHIVNLILRISILMMFIQLILATLINPQILNYSRILLKNSQLQFIPSLLKEKQFNDTVKGLTIFVNKKNEDGTYENIFIRDDGNVLSQISSGSSTIYAKTGYISQDENGLILFDGNVQKTEVGKDVNVIKFEKTIINLSGLSTKTTPEPKIQETSTKKIVACLGERYLFIRGCISDKNNIELKKQFIRQNKIEINKRFGMPIFIPLIALITCLLLSSRNEKKISGYYKYFYFFIGVVIIISAEITVRYSGNSINHTAIYYSIPIGLLPLIYLYLIRTFKYENLN